LSRPINRRYAQSKRIDKPERPMVIGVVGPFRTGADTARRHLGRRPRPARAGLAAALDQALALNDSGGAPRTADRPVGG
jgi:hypothetical protein